MFPPPRRRLSRPVRILIGTAITLAILVFLAIGSALVLFDPNSLKPRIEAAVKQATGRDFAIKGKIGLNASLNPVLTMTNVELGNIQGGSSSAMATVARAEAQVAIVPLFFRRIVLRRINLIRLRVLLETNAAGQPNWDFQPTKPAAPNSTASAGAAEPEKPLLYAIEAIHIRDAEVHIARAGAINDRTIAIPRFDMAAPTLASPVTVRGQATMSGADIVAEGSSGSLSLLQNREATAPWPFKLAVETKGFHFDVAGQAMHPLAPSGYAMDVHAAVSDGNPFQSVVPGLAAVRTLEAGAKLSDSNNGQPTVTDIAVRANGRDDAAALPSVTNATLQLTAATAAAPLAVSGQANVRNDQLKLTGTTGSVMALIATFRGGPLPLDLAADYAGAKLQAKGQIGSWATLSGVDVAVGATLADLITASKAAGALLPSVHDLSAAGRVREVGGSLANGVKIEGFTFKAPGTDVNGSWEFDYGGRSAIRTTLRGEAVDINPIASTVAALLRSRRESDAEQPQAAPPSAASAPAPTPAPGSAGAAAKPPGDMPQPGIAPPPLRLVFANRPIPVEYFNRHDVDAVASFTKMKLGAGDYANVVIHLFAQDGKAAIDPLSADSAGGKIAGKMTADTTVADMPVGLEFHAPALSASDVLSLFGMAAAVNGNADTEISLRASGRTPHLLAATLNGQMALSMVNGSVENSVLAAGLDRLLRAAKLPEFAQATGSTTVRCAAIRADIVNGLANVPTVLLDTSRLQLKGIGSVGLNDESIAFRLYPMLHGSGTGFTIPIRLGGTFTAPAVRIDALAALAGAEKGGDASGDACPAALASARNGRPGPSAESPPPAAAPRTQPARGAKG